MAKKKTLEEVQNEIEQLGFKLLDKEYVNAKTKLTIECPNGHHIHKTLYAFKRKPICEACEKNKTTTEKAESYVQKMSPPPKPKGTRRVLALDDATSKTGIAVFDGNKLVYYGKVEASHPEAVERISFLRQLLLLLISEWKPDIVAIEDIQLQDNVQTFKVLAQLQGVLENALYEKKVEYYIVSASTWKAHCRITGRNRQKQKQSAQERVKQWYGVVATQDECDAICLGKYVADKYATEQKLMFWGE